MVKRKQQYLVTLKSGAEAFVFAVNMAFARADAERLYPGQVVGIRAS